MNDADSSWEQQSSWPQRQVFVGEIKLSSLEGYKSITPSGSGEEADRRLFGSGELNLKFEVAFICEAGDGVTCLAMIWRWSLVKCWWVNAAGSVDMETRGFFFFEEEAEDAVRFLFPSALVESFNICEEILRSSSDEADFLLRRALSVPLSPKRWWW